MSKLHMQHWIFFSPNTLAWAPMTTAVEAPFKPYSINQSINQSWASPWQLFLPFVPCHLVSMRCMLLFFRALAGQLVGFLLGPINCLRLTMIESSAKPTSRVPFGRLISRNSSYKTFHRCGSFPVALYMSLPSLAYYLCRNKEWPCPWGSCQPF